MEADREGHNTVFDPAAIDQLRELQGDGEPDVLAELIEMYIADTELRITSIQAALGEERYADIERGVHALAGGSAVFGAEPFITVCRQLQGAAREGDLGAVRDLVERLRQEYDRLLSALNQEISDSA